MIMLLKINVADKILGKICLKAIGATFFPICGPLSGEERGTGGGIQQKGKVQTFSLSGGHPPPVPSLSVPT